MPSFRAKARAVDLLGKGQIADLPTAICELWKNGYDAYADNLSCDLYLLGYKGLNSPVFTLSDDGTGMSKTDIEEKWIVLGTDSRVRGAEPLTEEERLGKPIRIPMGEKGIGRLSVSYLGPKMFMITKKKNGNCLALFIDWRILDNWNLYLNDIDIHIKEIPSSSGIKKILFELVNEFEQNLQSGNWEEHQPLANDISRDAKNFNFPDFLVERIQSDFYGEDSHGTIFIVFDPHDQLTELSKGDRIDIRDDPAINYLRTSLSGINNSFKEERLFKTGFFIHDSSGKYDLIAKENFFTREDVFSNSDHYLIGSFDENGFFKGELKVYNQIIQHKFRPRRPPGQTPYGPLKIEFGFVEGMATSSILPREKWDIIIKKCIRFGGLYLYRDKFRVLPYGRTDYDFLKFEERRSLSATYYQFSHRRIFGYIEISRNKNPSLKDKAGREGFIENRAYREFKEDLIEFFVDLAVRFFRTKSPEEREKYGPTLREEQADVIKQRNRRILRAEKKRSKMTATRFKRELQENSEKLDMITNDLKERLTDLEQESKKDTILYNKVSQNISQIGSKKIELGNIKLVKPRRIELTDRQTNRYHEYRERYDAALELIGACNALIDDIHEKLSEENLKKEFEERYGDFMGDVSSTLKGYRARFTNAIEDLDTQMKDDLQTFPDVYAEKTGHLILSGNEDNEELKRRIEQLGAIYDAIKEEIEDKYDSFVDHVESLSFDIDDDLLVGWYKEQYEKISEKVEALHELAQLGMAIEIIDHQFNVLYAEMSEAIDFFKRFTSKKPEIEENYRQLRIAFEHLENNHKLLTPLYRTMRRTKTEITGSEIKDYLEIFFAKRFERHRIKFTTDASFDNYVFYTYESVIKPAFINIINNALYWLIPASDRKIKISYENGKILIMDSGEGIEYADLDRIFTLFFTRKPGGRGIGLYLAKTNLHTIGYEIYASNDKNFNRLGGACFIMEKIEGKKDEF